MWKKLIPSLTLLSFGAETWKSELQFRLFTANLLSQVSEILIIASTVIFNVSVHQISVCPLGYFYSIVIPARITPRVAPISVNILSPSK